MSLDKIKTLIGQMSKTMEDNEKLATSILSAKLVKYASENPDDRTIGSMHRVIDEMVNKNRFFITRSEFKNLYNKLYTKDSNFSKLFEEELKQADFEPTLVKNIRVDSSIDLNQSQDKFLTESLVNMFEGKGPIKFSSEVANNAIKTVKSTLNIWNLTPKTLKVEDGNNDVLVINASYETPKGITSILIPVETSNKTASASLFVGNSGAEDLNYINLKSYLQKNTGVKLNISASTILQGLNKLASKSLDVVELAALKVKSAKTNEFGYNQIIGQKLNEVPQDEIKVEASSNEFKTFEERFASELGIAESRFTDKKVNIARNYISRELNTFGYKNAQVNVNGSNSDTIFYGVSLGALAFTVPVKIKDNKIMNPTIVVCNSKLSEFNKEGIGSLLLSDETDHKVLASNSKYFGNKPSELVDLVKTAMKKMDLDLAEDALNVLANGNDAKAYLVAFNYYTNGLSGKQEKETSCNKIIKNSTSSQPICSHTGLPVNKVYQDKFGHCLPLYRRGMSETYEGAVFNNSKIFG